MITIGYVRILDTCIEAISRTRTCKAQGTIVIPVWKFAHFWPVFVRTEYTGVNLYQVV